MRNIEVLSQLSHHYNFFAQEVLLVSNRQESFSNSEAFGINLQVWINDIAEDK